MPPRRKPAARRGRPSKPRYALATVPRRRMLYNPQPIFTETFRLKKSDGSAADLLPNAGFLLSANIGSLPQLTQYSGLYQKYRILKATFMILPTWTGGEQQNPAIYNTVSGNFPTLPGVSSAGTSRIVSVVDTSPDQAVPISEDAVLQENGCKIRFLDKMVKLSCSPVPDLKDSNNVQLTLKAKYINFSTGNPNVAHFGVRGWITHPYSLGTGTFNIPDSITYAVYCKLKFQIAEPR